MVEKADLRTPRYPETMKYGFYPNLRSRIVFNVYSNEFANFPLNLFPNTGNEDYQKDMTITKTTPYYQFGCSTRSWWHLDYQGGKPYAHWKKAVLFVRLKPDWTKYYKHCRDGLSITSVRVAEDALYDLLNFIFNATDEQVQFMKNDPLLQGEFKDIVEFQEKEIIWRASKPPPNNTPKLTVEAIKEPVP